MLAKVKEADGSFDLDKFDLGFHLGVTKALTTFEPPMLLLHYGFIDPKKQALSLFGRNEPDSRTRRHTSTLKSLHKCRVTRCPGHAHNLGHVICSTGGCTKQVTELCYLTSFGPGAQSESAAWHFLLHKGLLCGSE